MIKVAVIGVGSMGRNHARVLSEMPGVKLVGVADVNLAEANAIATKYETVAYKDYNCLLDDQKPDAVVIAVPTSQHKIVGLATIERGINTLMEKPLAATAADADVLVEAAERKGVILSVGHIERFNPAVQELKRRVDGGELGKITSIIAKRVGMLPSRIKDANVIVDLAVHDIDIFNYLIDALPTEVFATGGKALLSDRYDHAEIFLKYNHVGCFILVNWITPLKVRTLSITGDKGHAELNYMTQKLEIFESNLERSYDDFGDFLVRFGTPRTTLVPLEVQEPLKLELKAFIEAICDHVPLVVKSSDGLQTMRVVERVLACLDNSNSGTRVSQNEK
ncbi:MAG: oxidoreductase [Anaerolinea sp.]|nr:oxidoreductase [Anaerolinea sp.]